MDNTSLRRCLEVVNQQWGGCCTRHCSKHSCQSGLEIVDALEQVWARLMPAYLGRLAAILTKYRKSFRHVLWRNLLGWAVSSNRVSWVAPSYVEIAISVFQAQFRLGFGLHAPPCSQLVHFFSSHRHLLLGRIFQVCTYRGLIKLDRWLLGIWLLNIRYWILWIGKGKNLLIKSYISTFKKFVMVKII